MYLIEERNLSNHVTLSFYLPIPQWLKTVGSQKILVTYIMHTIYYCCFIPVNNRMLMGKLYYQPCCLRSNTFCISKLRLNFIIIGALIESFSFCDNHFSKVMETTRLDINQWYLCKCNNLDYTPSSSIDCCYVMRKIYMISISYFLKDSLQAIKP